MGTSQKDKAQTRARVVDMASRRFRERGLDGIGVAELMKDAGLTVGGFYKHFASRDELVTESVDHAFGTWKRWSDRGKADGSPVSFKALSSEYLGDQHRDNPGNGCPFVALSSDLARSSPETRAVATEGLKEAFEFLANLMETKDGPTARAKAIMAYCAMIGAVSLARLVDDRDLGTEILRTVNQELNCKD